MPENECRYHCNNGKVFLPSMGLVPCPDCAGKALTPIPDKKLNSDNFLQCDPTYRPVIGFNYDDEEYKSRYAAYEQDPNAYTSGYDYIYKLLNIPECYRLGAGKAQRLVGSELDADAIIPETSVKLLLEMEQEAKKTGRGQNVVDVGFAMYDAFKHGHVYNDSIIMTFGNRSLNNLVYALQMTAAESGLSVVPYINAVDLDYMIRYTQDIDLQDEERYMDIPCGQLSSMEGVPPEIVAKRYLNNRVYNDYCNADVVFVYIGPATTPLGYISVVELLEARANKRRPTYVIGTDLFSYMQNRYAFMTLDELIGTGYNRLTKVMQPAEKKNAKEKGKPAKKALEVFGTENV